MLLELALTVSLMGQAYADAQCLSIVKGIKVSEQPNGPRCLLGAAATAMSIQLAAPSAIELGRKVRIMPSGIDPFDLQMTVQDLQHESLVFTGPPEAAARLVEAHFAPIAFIQHPGGDRHAVTITGAKRRVLINGTCGSALTSLRIFDPQTGAHKWQSAKSFADIQSEAQMMVFFDRQSRDKLDDAGFPIAAAEAVDRRFRAQGWVRRALAHPAPNQQSIRLLERAAKADPEWSEPAKLLAEHKAALAL